MLSHANAMWRLGSRQAIAVRHDIRYLEVEKVSQDAGDPLKMSEQVCKEKSTVMLGEANSTVIRRCTGREVHLSYDVSGLRRTNAHKENAHDFADSNKGNTRVPSCLDLS